MNLKTYLDSFGKSISDFADEISVSAPAVSRYAGGKRMPDREVMERIYTATSALVQPNDFYGYETTLPKKQTKLRKAA